MALLTLLAHPYAGSFAHAVAAALSEPPSNEVFDLCADDFSPLLSSDELRVYLEDEPPSADVARYQRAIEHADHLALVFPVWWGGPPSILKGFFDRVLLPSWAFDVRPSGEVSGRMNWIRSVHVYCTLDSPDEAYNRRTVAAMAQILGETTFGFCGIDPDDIVWHVIAGISATTNTERQEWLAAASSLGRQLA